MRLSALLAASLVLGLPAAAQETPPRAMTTDDGLDMVNVDGAVISPDGDWVLYSKSELDWKANKRKTTWWRVSSQGGDPHQYIGEAGGSGFTFSPDGSRIAFTRTVDEKAQLFLLRTAGGEAVKLTDHKSSVGSFEWLGDGSALVFVADEPRTEEEEKARKDGDDAIVVDEGPNGVTAGDWSNLWRVEIATGEETRLTEVDHRIGSFSVSPDGSRIAFTARFENRRNQSYLSEIFLLDVTSGQVRQLTDNHAPEGRVLFAPDGNRIAYEAPSDEEWELRLDKIWVMDVDSGTRRMVSGGFQGNAGRYVWTPDGRALLFGGLQRMDSNLFRLDLESGRVTQVTQAVGTLSPSSFSRDRTRMAYSFEDFDTPSDVWVGPTDGGPGTKITAANPEIESRIALASSQVVKWTSVDGLEIEGILVLPRDRPRGPMPLLLHIHGGPAGVFANRFSASYHVWAGLGYAQLLPNVRGSSGYTDDLLRGNMQDIGGGDFQDLMTGVDHVVGLGIADPDSLAVRGWSYGGILGGWTVTQTDRFKAASLGAMVSDWTSEYGPGFNHDVRLWYIGGTPWDNADEWRKKSSLSYVGNVKTPTLLLHGMNDRTDTEAQSMMFFQALKDQGKETRYIRFPREPHGFREPRHQRMRDVEEIRWIQKYLRGLEWTPWERKADEKKEETKVIS
ncbi:MAG TPA: S9 family peptidase [Longimicrobiales bacterium]|nr:S9 family peptidase [Longimicrobiales bacterium]